MKRTLKKTANCVLGRPSPCDVPEKSTPQSSRSLRPCWTIFLSVLASNLLLLAVTAISFALLACAGPTLAEQKAQILDDKIHFDGLSIQAFLETWGKPAYQHSERMQFFTLDDGNSIPRFRAPMGVPPQGWATAIISADSVFFGYPDRGEFLGFANGILVYREKMPADEIHSIAKTWAMEDRFKTRLETPNQPTPSK